MNNNSKYVQKINYVETLFEKIYCFKQNIDFYIGNTEYFIGF